MLTRRRFLKKSAIAGACAIAPQAFASGVHTGAGDGRPNILFIFTDQQTLNGMSAAGNPWLQTPNMDALARFGVRFENSSCASPICTPSRGSLVTGTLPHQHGAVYNNTACEWERVPRMGKLLQDGGYRAVWAGKWHLPSSYPALPNQKLSTLIPDFEVLPFFQQGLDTPWLWSKGDHTDGPLTDAVVDWFKRNSEQPFMLSVSLHNPHDICYFPSQQESYPDPLALDAAPPLPSNFEIPGDEPEFLQDCRRRTHYGDELRQAQQFSDEQWRRYRYHYYRMIERVDAQIGRIIRALEKSGLDEKTLIIFTSDHGDGVASHRWAAKLSLYQESVAVPFIVTQFGRTRENIVDREHPISGLDVLPTMLDFARIAVPSQCQGRSLRPLIEGRNGVDREFVVSELAVDPQRPERQGRMIRTARYKYNRYSYGARNEQLFDLSADPGEMTNLVEQPDAQAELNRHRAMLKDWMKETADPLEGMS